MLTSDEEKPYKEILYLLLESVRATKAAFYLIEPNGGFGLVTQYGFGRSDRLPERVTRTDALAQAVFEKREPFYQNDVRAAGRLAELMAAASSTRILASPVYFDDRVVGILDVRDKAGRVPFEPKDVVAVQEVLRRLAQRLRGNPRLESMFPQEEMPSTGVNKVRNRPPSSASTPAGAPASSPSLRLPHSVEGSDFLPSGVERTRQLVEQTVAAAPAPVRPAGARGAGAREAAFYRTYLEGCLAFPDVEIAALSVLLAGDAAIHVCGRRTLGPDAEQFLIENLERLHSRSGASFPMPETPRILPLRDPEPEARPMERAEIAAIQSSLLASAADELTILSLVFRHGSGGEDRDAFKSLHALLKGSLTEIREATRYREAFRGLVNKLLEPGLRKLTALRIHSLNVGRTARKFAAHLRLPAADVEQVTVAAILHDVGMRDLNYDELYQKRTLTDEERNLLREHPRVGAFLLSDIPWPYDIVPLVRHHHERWDGEGYPDRIRGEQIPLGARIIHLCEAFDAMTSPSSYRAVISVHQALDILESKGGTQFDPELAPAFKSMVEGWKA